MIARDVQLIEASDPFQEWQAANGLHVTVTDEDGDEVHVPEQCPRCQGKHTA